MNELYPTIHSTRQRPASRATVTKNATEAVKSDFKETLDKVTLSGGAQISSSNAKSKKSPEIRYDLVKKFQKELKKGFYEIKADEIAEKIVQKIKDDKDLKFV